MELGWVAERVTAGGYGLGVDRPSDMNRRRFVRQVCEARPVAQDGEDGALVECARRGSVRVHSDEACVR